MKNLALFVLFAAICAGAQQANDLTIDTKFDFKPLPLVFRISLPESDPMVQLAKLDDHAKPAKMQWIWEDKKVSESPWPEGKSSATISHTLNAPGTYSIIVSVIDRKGRLILQRIIHLKAGSQLEILP